MTAEVAVLNLSAVALAADSAATAGNKIQIADKLFTLSKYHPLGVMIYGSSGFCGVPFETLIKTYRHGLGRKEYGSVAESVVDFANFVATDLISSKRQQLVHAQFECHRLFTSMLRKMEKLAVRGGPSRVVKSKVIEEWYTYISSRQVFAGLEEVDSEPLPREYLDVIAAVCKAVFSKTPLSAAATARAIETASLLLTRDMGSDSHDSGIVFAGFGADELFPALHELVIDGAVCGKVRARVARSCIADRDGTLAQIVPFAQKDMMHRYIEGIDPTYGQFLDKSLSKLLFGNAVAAAMFATGKTKLSKAVEQKIRSAASEAFKTFETAARGYRRQSFIEPLTNVLVNLPKEELANLAEALVSLTSLKRRMSANERETVGGPVDVAVISKGDGFIWVKRKHYFQPQLNHHFLANYFNGKGGEDAN